MRESSLHGSTTSYGRYVSGVIPVESPRALRATLKTLLRDLPEGESFLFLFAPPPLLGLVAQLGDWELSAHHGISVAVAVADGAIHGRHVYGEARTCVLLAGRLLSGRCTMLQVLGESHDRAAIYWSGPPPEDDRPALLVLLVQPVFPHWELFLDQFQQRWPNVTVIGGVVGYFGTEHQPLWCPHSEPETLAVGVLLEGVPFETLVCPGCRPIGPRFIVTKGSGQVVWELAGRPAREQLERVFWSLPPADQQRVRAGLHLGRVIEEQKENFGAGDFLIRNVMGVDPDGGVIVGDRVRVGRTVQFLIRDAAAAASELVERLRTAKERLEPGACLLFSCNGRMRDFYPESQSDPQLAQSVLGNLPLAGFFAGGEIGPVGGKCLLHGFTAVVGLLG
jgi:small ligand-binding sensory domain FIST